MASNFDFNDLDFLSFTREEDTLNPELPPRRESSLSESLDIGGKGNSEVRGWGVRFTGVKGNKETE